MRVIAIIGPFTAPTPEQRYQHLDRAQALARDVWALGAVAYCPHAMTGYLFGIIPEDVIGPGLLELCRRCDAGLLVPGWQGSAGSLHEKSALEAQGKPVFESLDELKAWLDA